MILILSFSNVTITITIVVRFTIISIIVSAHQFKHNCSAFVNHQNNGWKAEMLYHHKQNALPWIVGISTAVTRGVRSWTHPNLKCEVDFIVAATWNDSKFFKTSIVVGDY